MKKITAIASEIVEIIKIEWANVNANQLYDVCCLVAKPKVDSKPRLNPWRF